jgi:hypothetical protein
MSEKPLDRLNYYNGQRLEASDLKLEQQYHIRVRRWLNKSLYTTGIASGLEVTQDPANAMNVIVSPGLALDSQGREIILLDQVSIGVVGKPSSLAGIVDGNYLTIQYSELVTEDVQDGCNPIAGKKSCCGNGGSTLAWGGPALVRAQALLGWTDALPSDTSGKIVLAQVELKGDCTVNSVHPEVRRYVGAASEALVHQFALEGEREITSGDGVTAGTENSTTLYFHIRGRQPNAVTLYLHADSFTTFHYTEMGDHTHALSQTGNVKTSPPTYYPNGGNPDKYKHQHSFGPLFTGDGVHTDGDHTGAHGLFLKFAEEGVQDGWLPVVGSDAFFVPGGLGVDDRWDNLLAPDPATGGSKWFSKDKDGNGNPRIAQITGGGHGHTIRQAQTSNVDPFTNDDHTHTFAATAMANAGVTDPAFPNGPYSARSGAPLTYFNDLRIFIDKVDQTAEIVSQLNDTTQTGTVWAKLGDGTANHPIVVNGTGEVKLDFLPGVSFDEGEHTIEFHCKVGTDPATRASIPTGGRILYNLYVE